MEIFDIGKYLYFWGSLLGVAISLYFLIKRKDLRREMILAGIGVALIGVISEYFFFEDYWRPPLIYRFGKFGGIEDLLFGFAAGSIGSVIYNLISNSTLRTTHRRKRLLIPILIISNIVIILFSINILEINSIYASTAALFFSALIMYITRPDLRKDILISAIISGLVLVIGEGILLAYLGKDYLERYFLLHGKIPVLFNIFPATEFLWGLSFGAVIGPLYEVLTGRSSFFK